MCGVRSQGMKVEKIVCNWQGAWLLRLSTTPAANVSRYLQTRESKGVE